MLQSCLVGVLHCFLLFCCLQIHLCFSADTLSSGRSLTGSQTITSSGGVFELGYFSLGNPARYYIGIWYKEISDDKWVWVANRRSPLQNNTADFKISEDGNLIIQTQSKSLVWSTNLTSTPSSTPRVAVLLDSGNLQLRDGNSSGTVVWDSFSDPTDTLLPGGRLELDKVTKQNIAITSWKNKEDPFPGPFTQEIDPNGTAQLLLVWNRTHPYWNTGAWIGKVFSALPEMASNPMNNFSFIKNDTMSYFTYSVVDNRILTKLVVDVSGHITQSIWSKEARQWKVFWKQPAGQCIVYAICGAFGICNQDNVQNPCECVDGFEPSSNEEWDLNDWSGGCVRKNKLQCEGDQFSLMSLRLPENADTATVGSAEGCLSACLKDCLCTAYSFQNSACSIWKGDLLNLQQQSDGSGAGIYIRKGGRKRNSRVILFVAVSVAAIVCAGLGACALWRCKAKMAVGAGAKKERLRPADEIQYAKEREQGGSLELPLFELQAIMAATNNFSESNKLGAGGFGPVYKGMLDGEQEVAVKRLSKGSKQGREEFMNEVKLIAKLQHINLVQLLGCCVEEEERILVYEYMPNKSLDRVLFDPALNKQLVWELRFEIVIGIARGLQYLHQESRLKVIHRDLKTSNILLDGKMNPRISDFGLARIFCGDQSHISTNKVAGTCGYMPPEYAMEGRYSTKSDVFSFGVIVLEIVSGLKITSFHNVECSLNLLGHAWKLWNEERALELLDPTLGNIHELGQVMRCINVGLLCVQEDVQERPTMSSIVLMLSGDSATLPAPRQPAYSYKGMSADDGSSSTDKEPMIYSPKDVTISVVEPR